MNKIVSTLAPQASPLRKTSSARGLQRFQPGTKRSFYSQPPNPNRIKTTIYLTPTSQAILCQLLYLLGYSTISSALDSILLWLGRELRLLSGVGPRGFYGFLAMLGLEDTLPPEYRYTAQEREYHRAQRARNVGMSDKSSEQLRLEREKYEQECMELLRGELSLALAEAEEIPQFAQVEHEVEEVPQLIESEEVEEVLQPAQVELRPRFRKPPTRKEASLCSEKVSELVTLAALYCPEALDRALDRAQGRTIEALESELTSVVEMNRPETNIPAKRRLKRDLS
jgi:DnaJ-domain-containing protein 1